MDTAPRPVSASSCERKLNAQLAKAQRKTWMGTNVRRDQLLVEDV